MRIAVLIPCHNEALTIRKVVADFRRELPETDIFVYDNASTDGTATEAEGAGAIVRYEPKKGKGNVVCRMFDEINADIYVMVDGDDTYPASEVKKLIGPVASGHADMVVGNRLNSYTDKSFRRFHRFGNKLITSLIGLLFRAKVKDIFSGYRAFSKNFVKSNVIFSKGFEIETELTLQAIDRNYPFIEMDIPFRSRPGGSVSKLNTFRDGISIIKTVFWIFKHYRPLIFFSSIAGILFVLSLLTGIPVILEFISYRYVYKVPSAVLSASLMILSFLSFSIGLILDTIARNQREIVYLISKCTKKNSI